jgi:trigger factor
MAIIAAPLVRRRGEFYAGGRRAESHGHRAPTMEVQVVDSGPCRKTVSISIPPEKVREHLESVYQSAANQVQMKGFRPGKVPRKLLEQKFGPAILSEAKESLINNSFNDALREHRLAVVGSPRIDGVRDEPLDPAGKLEFQVHVDVRPEFELGEVRGIGIKRMSTAVTDEDLESALRQITDQKRKLQPTDDPIEDGDFVKVDVVYVLDKAPEPIKEQKGLQLNTNIPIAGTDPQVFAAKLRGASRGDTRAIPITFPPTFEVAAARGQTGEARLTILDTLRIMAPPLDDELARQLDFDSLDALKGHLSERIGKEKERLEKLRQEDEMIRKLMDDYPFDVPSSLVEDQVKHMLASFEQQLKQSGAPAEEIEKRIEEAKPQAQKDAETRVRVFFLLDAIARKEKVFVTEGDVEAEIRTIAAQNNATAEQVWAHYEKHKLLADLRVGIMERKVRDFLRESAKITDS